MTNRSVNDHLQTIGLKPSAKKQSGFQFTLPLVQHFGEIELRSPVTFFVGENGSGKSKLIESLAAAINLPTVGGEDLARAIHHPHAFANFDGLSRSADFQFRRASNQRNSL